MRGLKRGLYTFFDILGRIGFSFLETLPKPLAIFLMIPFVVPAMFLAMLAKKKGESSQDVL